MTQKMLAEFLGIHPSRLNRIETGKANPPKKLELQHLATILELKEVERQKLFALAGYSSEANELLVPVGYAFPFSQGDTKQTKGASRKQRSASGTTGSRLMDLLMEITRDSYISYQTKQKILDRLQSYAKWLFDTERQKVKEREGKPGDN